MLPCRATEEAGHFMDDKPYMVSFMWMHVHSSGGIVPFFC